MKAGKLRNHGYKKEVKLRNGHRPSNNQKEFKTYE